MKRSLIFLFAVIGVCRLSWAQDQPLTFSASGDIPYGTGEFAVLQRQINDHNKYSPSAFFIHVGDIKSESEACNETRYATVANLFKASAAPVYIVPGDNETADCSNPAQGMSFFLKCYKNFEQNFCSAPSTEHQNVRPENWAFVMNGVLAVGVNLSYGGSSAQQQAADWVKQQLEAKILQVRAAVIFAHYSPGHSTTFSTPFRQAAAVFGKPILFLHGHGHSWSTNYPFPELNILRVQVDNGAGEDPVEVTVTLDNSSPAAAFVFKRTPWLSPTIVNLPPCANAGADQTVDLASTATLMGGATDDGDPSGTLTTTWSVVSGPGVVTFDNLNSLATTAGFSAPGAYVLRLTANDSQLQGSDDVTINVQGPATPVLTINDVSLNEGNSGATNVDFTVSLAAADGSTVTVDYQIVDGTATSGDDYAASASSGTLTFAGATATQTITVAINGDAIDEMQDETFFVNLSNATNATITDNQGQGTIVNDDVPVPPAAPANLKAKTTGTATIDLSWSDQSNNEDGFKIERKTGSGAFAEVATVSANANSYNDTGLNPSAIYTYRVRAFTASTSSAYSNTSATETGSGVVASPGVNIALNKVSSASSSDGSYPATKAFDGSTSSYWRSGSISSSNITQWLRVDLGVVQTVGRAMVRWKDTYFAKRYELQVSNNDVDWTTVYSNPSGVAGNADFSFTPALARYVRVYMTLNNGSTYRIYELEIYSGPTLPTLTINDVSLNEGNSGTTDAVFTVSLTGVPQGGMGAATVDYQIAAGTATSGDDYVANSGMLTFSGSTTSQTITVAINGDAIDEAQDETFFVNLSNATNAAITDAQGQGTIVNDDAPAPPAAPANLKAKTTGTSTVDLTWSDQSNDEDGFKIERKAGSGAFAEVATVSANANSHNDTGLNASTVYTYRVCAFTASTSSAYSNTSATETGSGVVASPGVNIALNKASSASSSDGSYPATKAFDGSTSSYWRSGSISSSNITQWLRVDLGVVQTVGRAMVRWKDTYFAKRYELQVSNNDVDWTTVYSNPSGVAGNADFSFTPALARYVRVYMTLNNAGTYRIYEFEVYSGPILPALAINDVSLNEGNSGTTEAIFTVSLTGVPQGGMGTATVDYQIVAGTATEGDDYTPSAASGTLTFSGSTTSQTITVAINGDANDEAQDETFFVNLSNATNAAITDAQGQGMIVNDDAPVPPGAPANLAANATSSSEIALTWQDNSADETGFKIERKTGSGSFSEIATVSADATSYNDTGLSANTTYTYRVRAFNSNVNSNYSNETAATIGATSSNLALNKPTVALSTYSTKPTKNAVDGDVNTYWRCGSLSSSNPINWLRVDLGAAMMVGQVVVKWREDYYAKTFEAQVSSDDVSWTPVASGSGAVGIQTLNFSATPARYVRLYLTLNNRGSYRVAELEVYASSSATAKRNANESEAAKSEVVTDYGLEQNYPNPFNPSTQIRFALPQDSQVTIKVYSINGAEVKTLVDDRYTAGTHAVTFHAGNLPSGTYFYVMQAGNVRQVRQLRLVK